MLLKVTSFFCHLSINKLILTNVRYLIMLHLDRKNKNLANYLANQIEMNEITDIIVDWDDTCICGGSDVWSVAFKSILKNRFSIDLSLNEVSGLFGRVVNQRRAYELALTENYSEEYTEEELRLVRNETINEALERVLKYPLSEGFNDVVNLVKSNGIKLHIYTFKEEELIKKEVECRQIKDIFDTVNGSTDALWKTDLGAIVQKIPGLNPKTTLVIGDGNSDVAMAKNFNCHCIRINRGELENSYKKLVNVSSLEMAACVVDEKISQNKMNSLGYIRS